MKKYKSIFAHNGFVCIECIVSLSIICIMTYLISTTLNNSCNLINKNQKNIEMLNIAKNCLEEEKYNIQNSNEETIEKIQNRENIDNYNLETKLEKEGRYSDCYRVNVVVKNNNEKVELSGYVTKK